MKVLRGVGRIFSPDEPVRRDVDVVLAEGRVAAVVPGGSAPACEDEFDCAGRLLTPGLVDAHTHPLYLRPRLEEVGLRANGASYLEIARAGGGINATVKENRAASTADLEAAARGRLRAWLQGGSTTVEVKTGYWLEREGELAGLRLISRLGDQVSLPTLVATYLGAHDLPPERRERRDLYVEEVSAWCPEARAAGASFCDVFCDQGAFTVAESERILEAARGAGLGLRLHADELALTGGSRLAARLGATSADHLLQIGEEEIAALAAAGTVATLCPVTALSMGKLPPARELAAAGVTLALGSDHNPGTSGTTSMSLIVYLAVSELGLTLEQALTAATQGGARSLGLSDRGRIEPGSRADLVLWETDHEGAFAWRPGLEPAQVWREGAAQL